MRRGWTMKLVKRCTVDAARHTHDPRATPCLWGRFRSSGLQPLYIRHHLRLEICHRIGRAVQSVSPPISLKNEAHTIQWWHRRPNVLTRLQPSGVLVAPPSLLLRKHYVGDILSVSAGLAKDPSKNLNSLYEVPSNYMQSRCLKKE